MLLNIDSARHEGKRDSKIVQLSLGNQVELSDRHVPNIINDQGAFTPKPLTLQLNTPDSSAMIWPATLSILAGLANGVKV